MYGDVRRDRCRGFDCGDGYDYAFDVRKFTSCQAPDAPFSGVYDLAGNASEWEDSCERFTDNLDLAVCEDQPLTPMGRDATRRMRSVETTVASDKPSAVAGPDVARRDLRPQLHPGAWPTRRVRDGEEAVHFLFVPDATRGATSVCCRRWSSWT